MAVSQSRVIAVAMAIVAIFALIGSSAAQESPAPAPMSSAGVASPSFAAGCAVAVVSRENWTKITFNPDLLKFSKTRLDDDIISLIKKRVVDITGEQDEWDQKMIEEIKSKGKATMQHKLSINVPEVFVTIDEWLESYRPYRRALLVKMNKPGNPIPDVSRHEESENMETGEASDMAASEKATYGPWMMAQSRAQNSYRKANVTGEQAKLDPLPSGSDKPDLEFSLLTDQSIPPAKDAEMNMENFVADQWSSQTGVDIADHIGAIRTEADDPEALVEAIQVGWTRSELGWFKLNVDASIQKDHMHQHALVAIGGVVRDMHGGFAGTVPDSSILAAELKSILQADFNLDP
ncbi:hypothetical protein BUALT_Bualt10G0121600 [Buddleja alternifolia]|uniref:Secreted protein n=1 Tax=Buddleja alternifolia TaxID=168488 RepID=A0AAV6WZ93_9LAMI|nr:hypothetical protein BUALT_Bualt10G0121600 [Buddleja alternifolia]